MRKKKKEVWISQAVPQNEALVIFITGKPGESANKLFYFSLMLNLADKRRVAKSFRGRSYYGSCAEASLARAGVSQPSPEPLGSFPGCRRASPFVCRAGNTPWRGGGWWTKPVIFPFRFPSPFPSFSSFLGARAFADGGSFSPEHCGFSPKKSLPDTKFDLFCVKIFKSHLLSFCFLTGNGGKIKTTQRAI